MGNGNYICALEKDPKHPCPDCGSRVVSYEKVRGRQKAVNRAAVPKVYIICRDCGRRTHVHKTVEDAIAEWNG